MFTFHCDQCGDIETVEFDGYAFGDRLLEGVYFVADKKGNVTPRADAVDYLKSLNAKKWLKDGVTH